ncbi:MAG: hypothetical protein LUC43_01260, partial [Burkholderiales bacterium]|nr:hypothetical protein [Burkholderiales bacterium]
LDIENNTLSETDSSAIVAGVLVGHSSSTDNTAVEGLKATISGDITVNYLSSGTNLEYGRNIYGVVVTPWTSTDTSKAPYVELEGNVVVDIGGAASNLALGSNSVYGIVDNSTTKDSVHLTGSTQLNFGAYNYTYADNKLTSADFVAFTNEGETTFSFSNFDTVNVLGGSKVYLTPSTQNATLVADDVVYGSSYPLGNDVLNGIESAGGVLLLTESSDAVNVKTDSNGTGYLYVTTLQNAGTITVDGEMVTTGATTSVSLIPGGTATSYQAQNTNLITGTGTLSFQPVSGETSNENFTNSGTITVPTVNIDGITLTNSGYLGTSDSFIDTLTISQDNEEGLATVLDSSGYVYATNVVMTGGTVSNTKQFTAKTFNLSGSDSLVQNTDTLAINTLNMTGGEIYNSSTGFVGTGEVLITGGTIENYGKMVSIDFQMSDDAFVNIAEGAFYVLNIDSYSLGGETFEVTPTGAKLDGGVMIVGNGSSKAETAAIAEFNPNSEIQTKVYVDGGKLGLGEVEPTSLTGSLSSTLDNLYDALAEALGVENSLDVSVLPTNLLSLTTRVTTGNTGYIGVDDSYSSASTATGLYFGGNSTLLLTFDADGNEVAGSSSGESAFTTTAGTSLTVDSGATVVAEGYYGKMPQRFYITSGYSYDTSQLWEDGATIKVVDQYGLSYEYEIHAEEENGTPVVYLGYYAQTEDNPDPPIYPFDTFFDLGYVAGNIILSDVENWKNPTAGAQAVIDIVGAKSLVLSQRVKIMNSIANLPFAGGVIGTAMDDLNGAITDLNNHLTMDSDTFGAHGVMWPYDEANNLWLDVTGTWYNQRHLKASKIDRAGWRASAFGFILGYDRKLKDAPVAMGAAFSFTGGNVKSTGNISYTKNKYQDYGVHLYSNYSPNEHLNVIGALHWMHNFSDVTQKVGVTATNGNYLSKAQGHMTTDWLALGVRFETSFSAGAFTFVPHVEPRYVYAKMRNFDTQIDGATIWNTHARGNNFFQIPIGIAARADFLTESGWTIRPNADITIVPQVGSTKLKTELRNSYNAADVAEGEFMGNFQTAVKLGVQFNRKNWTMGAKYGLVAGDRGKIDHGFILQARFRF